MLNKKSDQVLNIETISRILGYPEVSKKYLNIKKYYYELGKGTNILYVKVKPQYKDKINSIVNDIISLFSNDVQLNYKISLLKSNPKNPFYNSSINLLGGGNKITILFPLMKDKVKLSEVMMPGAANELILVSIIKDQLQVLKEIREEVGILFPYEFKPNLTLVLYEKTTPTIKGKIGPIKSISKVGQLRVGGLQQKSDVKIDTNSGPVNISLKQDIFPAWSSAMPYSGAKSVLNYLVNNNQVQVQTISNKSKIISNNNTYNGIAVPATVGEVKKYCFGDSQIDYIFVNTFSSGDIISEITKISTNNFTVDMKSNLIYKNIDADITRLQKNVFLSLESDTANSSGLMPDYPGFKVSFIPENKIAEKNLFRINTLPSISGRL
jgi:hypothetical protein